MKAEQGIRPHGRGNLWYLLVLLASVSCRPVHAADSDASDSRWMISGFGSLGLARSSEHRADFVSNVLRSHGAGYTGNWSVDVDSRVGAQVDLKLNSQWSAVLQVVTELGLDNNYAPIIEWANVKYSITPDSSVRIGKISLPMFLAADYRKVGYAHAMVRTPVEVYGSVPISSSDGVDASMRWSVGEVKNVTQVFFGHADIKVTDTARAKARALTGISNSTDTGALNLRISLLTANLTVDSARPLFDAFRQFGPPGSSIAQRWDADHKRATAISVGANYDPGKWFLMLEAGHLNTGSYLGDKSTFYASAGYRYGTVTPYLAHAQVRARSSTSDPGLPLLGLPPELAGQVAGLNFGLNRLLRSTAVQRTLSVGVRWDWRADMALKLQFDRVRPQGGSPGMLINVQPDFQSGRSINVVSAVLDFVF